jgi:hypothetical protein
MTKTQCENPRTLALNRAVSFVDASVLETSRSFFGQSGEGQSIYHLLPHVGDPSAGMSPTLAPEQVFKDLTLYGLSLVNIT